MLSSTWLHAQEDGKLHIHNHLRFTILYHRDPDTDMSRIVGFEVEPFSVKHKYDGKWNADRPELKTCNGNSMKFVSEKDTKQEIKEGEEIVFTYDVTFKVGRQPPYLCHMQPVVHAVALPEHHMGRSCRISEGNPATASAVVSCIFCWCSRQKSLHYAVHHCDSFNECVTLWCLVAAAKRHSVGVALGHVPADDG